VAIPCRRSSLRHQIRVVEKFFFVGLFPICFLLHLFVLDHHIEQFVFELIFGGCFLPLLIANEVLKETAVFHQ
jgi:hypothetical protein